MIFFGSYNAPNAPNAPNDVLKTTLFFTKKTLKYSSSTIIVQIKILKNLNVLKINMMRFLFVHLTIPFSNSFYKNLTDIYSLKELLYNEGIADYNGLPLIKPYQSNTLLLPQGY